MRTIDLAVTPLRELNAELHRQSDGSNETEWEVMKVVWAHAPLTSAALIDEWTPDAQLYYAYSLDGGVSWSPNEPLSPAWNPHLGWPDQDKIGDYYDMASDLVGAHVAYAATFNGEQDVYYLRIGDTDCNGNQVLDECELTSDADCNNNGIGWLASVSGKNCPEVYRESFHSLLLLSYNTLRIGRIDHGAVANQNLSAT